jgi:hypothetical protein
VTRRNGRPSFIPTARQGKAIRAYHGTHVVYLWQIEEYDKEYKCRICMTDIPAEGLPHTFIRYQFPDSKGYDHHHVHNQCARDWMDALFDPKIIPFRQVPLKRRRRK